jgi:hypothetical protein
MSILGMLFQYLIIYKLIRKSLNTRVCVHNTAALDLYVVDVEWLHVVVRSTPRIGTLLIVQSL